MRTTKRNTNKQQLILIKKKKKKTHTHTKQNYARKFRIKKIKIQKLHGK